MKLLLAGAILLVVWCAITLLAGRAEDKVIEAHIRRQNAA